jgi:hypothetical protein
MGEKTNLTLNTPNKASLRTTVPMFIVKQWGLEVGQQLDWSLETCNDVSGSGRNELVVVVRRAKTTVRRGSNK